VTQLLYFFRKYIIVVLLSSFFIISFGCVEEANPVGAKLIPPKDAQVLKVDTLYATSHYTQYVPSNNSGTDQFFVGNYGPLTSWGLLRFPLFADTVFGGQILSASVRLKVISHQGDSLAEFSFIPYKLLESFGGDSLTFDSLQANPSFYYDPTPIGKIFSRSHIGNADYIDFSLDTAVVHRWFTSLADSVNYGMLLMPTNTNVIKGFSSFNSYDSSFVPKLTVTYHPFVDSTQSIDITRTLTFEDTTSTSRYLPYLDSTSLNKDPKMLYVLAGIPYREVLTFKDVSRLPSPCIINSSTLKLAQNKKLTKLGGYVSDSLISTYLNDDGSTGNTFSTSIDSISSAGTPDHPHVVYSFDTRQEVQSWVEGYLKQPRIEIIGYNESSSFDLHVMYGSDTAAVLLPRIIVTYSTKSH
jgi:hypothetical protein